MPRGRVLGLALAWLIVAVTVGGGDRPGVAAERRPAPGTASRGELADFLARHWRRPIPPQGPAPAGFSRLESALEPEACGTCHPAQLADWRTSLHARAMGPGVTGQLAEMLEGEPDAAMVCFTCHAPLGEQAPLIRSGSALAGNPAYDPALRARGVACPACHVRAHQRFGPPRRDGSLASEAPRESLPHHGVTRTPAFLRSEFCASCHQFEPRDYALNGKLLENTYNEWKASRYAREGTQCQDCHMPDRRHRWRGIHDPEMVAGGVTITLSPPAPRARRGEPLALVLRVQNTGVGHAFPTYVTPRVVLRAELLDAEGRPLPDSRVERTIERAIALDLSREFRDTRLRPGETATLTYRRRVDPRATRVRVSVIVEPDAFYERFFATLLEQGAGRGEAQIREALADTRRSPFTLFEREVALEMGGSGRLPFPP